MIAELWKIGDVRIRRIVELALTAESGIMARLIPDATPEDLRALGWLVPRFVDRHGRMLGSVHALVVETPSRVILVDTCVGNDKPRTNPDFHMRHSSFLEDLAGAGYPVERIDTVLCTHLHVDHVGWNTVYRDGRWMPTFPRARYLFGEAELAHWRSEDHGALARLDVEAVVADSVQPILDAGLAELVRTDAVVCDEVRLIPTPGHTPGHASVLIESRGESALITGDFLHHPCQFAHPEWASSPDTDPRTGLATRRAMYERFADSPTLVIGTHFASPSAGRLVRDGATYRFDT